MNKLLALLSLLCGVALLWSGVDLHQKRQHLRRQIAGEHAKIRSFPQATRLLRRWVELSRELRRSKAMAAPLQKRRLALAETLTQLRRSIPRRVWITSLRHRFEKQKIHIEGVAPAHGFVIAFTQKLQSQDRIESAELAKVQRGTVGGIPRWMGRGTLFGIVVEYNE